MKKAEQLLKLCQGRPVYVQTHNYPDPDALASGHGLCMLLQQKGVQATLCYDGELDKRACKKMTQSFKICAVPLADLGQLPSDAMVIYVDSQRGNGNVTPLKGAVSACVDHHPTFAATQDDFQDIRCVGACSSLVAEYFQQLGLMPDRDTASALLYGMQVDTHRFSRGVSELDIAMLGFLNDLYDDDALRQVTSNTMAFEDLKAYANAIENLKVYGVAGFAQIDFACSNDLIAMISDFFLGLDEIELSVVYCCREDGVKFSVRSKRKEIHAGDWVRSALEDWGVGGGHSYMAGGVLSPCNIPRLGPYPDETIRDLFLAALKKI